MQAASKNYSFASAYLPAKLHHVEALYALMRVGDDRVDVSHTGFASPWKPSTTGRRLTGSFRARHSPHPVMRAYLDTAIECGIPSETMALTSRPCAKISPSRAFPPSPICSITWMAAPSRSGGR